MPPSANVLPPHTGPLPGTPPGRQPDKNDRAAAIPPPDPGHQQTLDLNDKLAAVNNELHGLNAGLLSTNAAVLAPHGEQRQLNDELEARVAQRTLALQQALAEAEVQRQALHALFDQAPMAITVVRGPNYVIELANPAVCAMWGRTQAQAVGTPLFELLPEAAGQGFEELLDGVMATGQAHVAFEIPSLIDRHGHRDTVYWDFTFQPLREADGQATGVTVLAIEVSERVTARLHLVAQQQLQAVFELAPVAIGVFTGPNYVVEVCNPGLQAIWGRSAAEALNRPLLEVLPEIRDQGFKELLDEVLRTGVPYLAHEMPLQVLHYGYPTTVYVNFVYHPLRDAQGHPTAIAVVATDVTEQVVGRRLVQQFNEANVLRLNQELATSNEELLRANQELSDSNRQLLRTNTDLDNFIYTASHDLKTPISNIEGLLHALLTELPPFVQTEPVGTLLALMQGAIERFQQTIVHLTDVSKLQLAHAQAAEQLDLAELVEHVRLDLVPALAAANVQLTVDVQACPNLSFAPKNMRSIVYNLLSNAVKYRMPGRPPVVHLRCRRTSEAVVLEVADNGLGLSEQQQTKLFVMFQRLHTHGEGSGIGLYMVKKMVENAGGTITVQSQPGVGSTFVVAFSGSTV